MKKHQTIAFLTFATASILTVSPVFADDDEKGEWRQYAQQPNGDIHFFDASRVETNNGVYRVWNRIRYKTSVMGASSYQNLLEIDCTQRTEKIVQNTFFSDKNWEKPAMSTDKNEKPKRQIEDGSATERLFEKVCDQ